MAAISFQAEGTRLTAFRDALRFRGIACKNQQIRENAFFAETSAANEKRIMTLAGEYDISVQILRRRGIRRLLLPYRRRYGLLCGLLCGMLFLHWCSATVREIVITGNSRVPEAELRTALASLGVREGVPFRSLNYNRLEQLMCLAVSDLEWITLRQEGGRLIADLTEERLPPPMSYDRMPTNYIAMMPAEVTSIDVRGGYAAVAVGDTVRAGDLLISGVQTDPNGICRWYHADGIVKGRYCASFSQEQPFVAELPVRGETRTQEMLEIFGRRIPLTFGFRLPDGADACRCTEETAPLMLFGKTLPVARVRRTFVRQETALTVYSEAEAKAILDEAAARFEHNFHANDLIISRKPEYLQTDLGILLKINYIFEGVIGKTSEIFVK